MSAATQIVEATLYRLFSSDAPDDSLFQVPTICTQHQQPAQGPAFLFLLNHTFGALYRAGGYSARTVAGAAVGAGLGAAAIVALLVSFGSIPPAERHAS